jgi:hypothetical protein
MSDVMFVVVTELPDLPEPRVSPVLPELKVSPVLPELREPLALRALKARMAHPALKARMASQGRMELLVDAALPEQRVLMARPARLALKGPKALRVDPGTADIFVREPRGRRRTTPQPAAS